MKVKKNAMGYFINDVTLIRKEAKDQEDTRGSAISKQL